MGSQEFSNDLAEKIVEMVVVVWKYRWEDIRVKRSVWEKKRKEKKGSVSWRKSKEMSEMSGGEGG